MRKRIRCRNVHLVRGNHDRDYSQDGIFSSAVDYKKLKTEFGLFILSHYPMLEWDSAHYGSVHLHGHIHSTYEAYNAPNLEKLYRDRFPQGHKPKREDLKLRIYDAGVDANDYRPVSIERIAAKMDLKPIRT